MLSIELQARIFKEYHAGKEYTNGTKYRYTLQYNPCQVICNLCPGIVGGKHNVILQSKTTVRQ